MSDIQIITTSVHGSGYNDGVKFDVKGIFSWDSEDPLVVSAGFPVSDEETKVWTLSRDLMRQALSEGSSGFKGADVTMRTTAVSLILNLSSPEGTAALIFPKSTLSAFIDKTYAITPEDEEWKAYQTPIDQLISDILEG
jgi:hypothetical protein